MEGKEPYEIFRKPVITLVIKARPEWAIYNEKMGDERAVKSTGKRKVWMKMGRPRSR